MCTDRIVMGRRKAPQPPAAAAVSPPTRRRKLDPLPVDCISTLPDDLLREIILLLPIKDGGRTQALASRWRHLWSSLPLDLDCSDLLPGKNSLLTSWELGLVSSVLSAHTGPGRRFCVPPLCPYATVENWLCSNALDSLEELELGGKAEFLRLLPASAFRFSGTLRVAIITSYNIPDAAVQGLFFPQLKKLRLEGVRVSESSLHGMIAGCPSLEFLAVRRGSGFRRLLVNSLTLRSISVQIAEPKEPLPDQLQFGELVIEYAPSLERLIQLYRHCWRMHVSVLSSPKVKTLGFLNDWKNLCTRLKRFSIMGLHVDSPTTDVHTVKTIAVDMSILSLDAVVDLMTLFPCLEKLHVKSVVSRENNCWRRKHQSFIKSHDIRLKTLVLEPYKGTCAHINFARFFVLNSRVLELVTFQIPAKIYNHEFLVQQHRKLQLEYKASSGAQFHFTSAGYEHADWSSKHLHDFDLNHPFLGGF